MVIIMLMSDMQNKEVINQITGANLGRIIDLDVNENGYINYLSNKKAGRNYIWLPFWIISKCAG